MTTKKSAPAKSEIRFYVILAVLVIAMAVMFFDANHKAEALEARKDKNQVKLNADLPKGPGARAEDWEAYRKEEQRLDQGVKEDQEDITYERHALFGALGLIGGLLGGREFSAGSKEEEGQ